MEDHHLPTTTITTSITVTAGETTTPPSASFIITRLLFIALVALISLWANHEASTGFEITIINDTSETPVGRCFNRMFVSNDKATRMVLKASEFAQRVLYPSDQFPKKPIGSVTLRLAGLNLTHMVVVNRSSHRDYVLYISPALMAENNVNLAMASALQGGMARVWLWDGHHGAPESLLDGIVDYISTFAGLIPFPNSGEIGVPEFEGINCWESLDRIGVVRFLEYCQGRRPGFLARLNQSMRDKWSAHMVDGALGLPSQQICASYYLTVLEVGQSSGSDSTSASGLSQVI